MEKVIEKLIKETTPLTSKVDKDEFITASEKAFDCIFDGISTFYPWKLPTNIPTKFKIGVIVGSSGSGKSTILKHFGIEEQPEWDNTKSIVSHFNTPDEAINKMSAVGLNSIPSWYKSYNVLSNGEAYRANIARHIKSNIVLDEFTSVVDRNTAMSLSISLSKYIKNNEINNVVISTCHEDIINFLEPDWIIDLNKGEFIHNFFFKRPQFKMDIYRCSHEYWSIFKNHHYLSGDINKSARCYIGLINNQIVAFSASLSFPSGTVKNGRRASRTVILPEWQGCGIGTAFSDAIAQIHIDEGFRYFSRTSHHKLGEHREKSEKWKATSKNRKLRTDVKHENIYKNHYVDNKRIAFSHEYIGLKD